MCAASSRLRPPSRIEVRIVMRRKPWIVTTVSTWSRNDRNASDSSGGDGDRRKVQLQRLGLQHAVIRSAQRRAALAGDHVGRLLERAAVVRHEAERPAQLALLDHTGHRQQLGIRRLGSRRRSSRMSDVM